MTKVNKDTIFKVLIEHEKKKNKLEIARILGISRLTVVRYLNILSEFEEDKEITISNERLNEIQKNATKIATIIETEKRGQLGEKEENKCAEK